VHGAEPLLADRQRASRAAAPLRGRRSPAAGRRPISPPAKLVDAARVEAACRALLDSRVPVKRIAVRCGFGDEERMRRAFLRRLGVAPTDYRARFVADASMQYAALV
jgi:AraC-like DNA-binding protein